MQTESRPQTYTLAPDLQLDPNLADLVKSQILQMS